MIGLSGRKDLDTKTGTLTLQDARLPCDKRMAYAAVGGRIGAEPAIRLLGQKDLNTKTGTLTLQNTRLLCDKCMAYAAVGGGLDAEPAIGHSRSEGGGYKNRHSGFAGCPIAMR